MYRLNYYNNNKKGKTMNNLNKIVLTSVLTLSSAFANASIITFGDLSTDVAYDIIADTERGREYLRFDKLSTTYAETITSISSGGIYEGWSVANSDISDDFINALFG